MIYSNEISEGEMSLESQVVLEIGGRYLGTVFSESLRCHELHHAFCEVAYQPLLYQLHHKTTLQNTLSLKQPPNNLYAYENA